MIPKSHSGRVAQVARATALQAVGHRFKSCPAYLLWHEKCLNYELKILWARGAVGLARLPVTQEVAGSSPVGPVSIMLKKPQVVFYNAVAFSLQDDPPHSSNLRISLLNIGIQATPTIEERHRRD